MNALVKVNSKPTRTKSGAAVRLMGGTITAENAREWQGKIRAATRKLWSSTGGPTGKACGAAALCLEDASLHIMGKDYARATQAVARAMSKLGGRVIFVEPPARGHDDVDDDEVDEADEDFMSEDADCDEDDDDE